MSVQCVRALFALGLVVACGAARAQPSEALVAAARREGSVAFYAGFPNAALQALTAKSFQDKYGIRVDVLQMRASELNERVRTEQAAGRFIADVMQQGESSTTLHGEAGRLAPLGELARARDPDAAPAIFEDRAAGFVAPYAILVNANLVTPADEPKSWLDLLDPRWKGKILVDDPRAAGGGGAFLAATISIHGEEFHRRFALNGPVFSRDPAVAERRVAAGEFPILVPALVASMPGLKGLPLRFLAPAEGVPSIRMDHAILKNAPHPAAARLFIEHFLSADFQAEIARLGLLPVVRGMEERVPAELRPFARARLLGGMKAESQQRQLNFATDVYK